MDAIALHSVGLHYAVASLGTSINERQLVLATSPLGSSSERTVVLALDADEAGTTSTMRLYESGVFARLAQVSPRISPPWSLSLSSRISRISPISRTSRTSLVHLADLTRLAQGTSAPDLAFFVTLYHSFAPSLTDWLAH